ncbi:DUF4192 family protein [Rathayibacter sp. VKM Ac-2759]|uniref:DUF4192 family protein n=1 Tax=Rathayibacter sp. VKM Ac-2759 TaxID=2609252 RepID=UPI001319A7CA|nr:DUF4192 family protein [Rathayibacter sp. VKM Ac-2759]QHC67068.1 DUF4192 family protein [Rathayibacter sp. VKM Ac-2759]
MTLTALHSPHHRLLASVPDLIGFVPSDCLVLVPLRGGRATGALRFDLPEGDAVSCARAYIGALGRFGRTESAVAVLYRDHSDAVQDSRLSGALSTAARRAGIRGFEVIVSGSRGAGAGDAGDGYAPSAKRTEGRLLPDVDRGTLRAVCAQVDALLDRHPRAELAQPARAGVDALLRRASAGRPNAPQPDALAALIVCAQRTDWRAHALRLVSASTITPSTELLQLVATAAASAPATERVPVLVLLATLTWAAGRQEDALRLADRAARSDPHDLDARRLVCALQQSTPAPQRSGAERAA